MPQLIDDLSDIRGYNPQDKLATRIVRRPASLFAGDIADNAARLADAISGRRVLVVGGGGSIGSMVTRLLVNYRPRAVHVIDHSENYLAELVRDIRNSTALDVHTELRFLPIDFGGPVAERLLQDEKPYDLVLNFAALKHVRSEKDVYSLLQMLDTNIVCQARFKDWIVARGGTQSYFGVSTDKAANPTSLMGASKRLMEDVLFASATSEAIVVTSARFANVAFSNGSLLQSWLRRLELGQPLAVPRDTRRYFVSQREAGEICLLAVALGKSGEIFIPRLNPEGELQSLESLAVTVLQLHGLKPVPFLDEAEARASVSKLRDSRRWPLLLTPLDTSGEKPYEEFVGTGEAAYEVGLKSLRAIRHARPTLDSGVLLQLEAMITLTSRRVSKRDIVELIASAVPSFRHFESEKTLDGRM